MRKYNRYIAFYLLFCGAAVQWCDDVTDLSLTSRSCFSSALENKMKNHRNRPFKRRPDAIEQRQWFVHADHVLTFYRGEFTVIRSELAKTKRTISLYPLWDNPCVDGRSTFYVWSEVVICSMQLIYICTPRFQRTVLCIPVQYPCAFLFLSVFCVDTFFIQVDEGVSLPCLTVIICKIQLSDQHIYSLIRLMFY